MSIGESSRTAGGKAVNDAALDQLFRAARTHRSWTDEPVSDLLLAAVYDLARMAPTSGNCSPGRFVFVTSPEAKARLKPALSPGNVAQTMSAPTTAIVAHDMEFYELMPRLYTTESRGWFAGDPAKIDETAFRNGTLQGAYLIMAARSLGLDCGPMSGFDRDMVDKEFFPDSKWRSNFLCNLGHGDGKKMRPRNPRLEFDEACRIL